MNEKLVSQEEFPLDQTFLSLFVDFPKFNKYLNKLSSYPEILFEDLYILFKFINDHSDTNYLILISEKLAQINKVEALYLGNFLIDQSDKAIKKINNFKIEDSFILPISNYLKKIEFIDEKWYFDINYYFNSEDNNNIRIHKYINLQESLSNCHNKDDKKILSLFLDGMFLTMNLNKEIILVLLKKLNQIGKSIIQDVESLKGGAD